jgi:ketosteroid isomerase-like protein
MKNVPSTALGNLYRDHINLILAKDINALLNQYSEDALLISSFEKTPKYFRGHKELLSWVLNDQGKIQIHFAGMTQYPDGSVA